MKEKALVWFKGSLMLVAAMILVGCGGALFTYVGAQVREGHLLALADGSDGESRYRASNLVMEYRWSRRGNELLLSGAASYAPGIGSGFTLIPYFHLSVFFTDERGVILAERGIATPGSSEPGNAMRFKEKFLLPPGTTHMAFSYSGQGRISGGNGQDRGGGETPFWEVPVVR
jgi:hypothetical protein